jgi:hypothetical protein
LHNLQRFCTTRHRATTNRQLLFGKHSLALALAAGGIRMSNPSWRKHMVVAVSREFRLENRHSQSIHQVSPLSI